eukprot:2006893-Rhodomonas_salina.3
MRHRAHRGWIWVLEITVCLGVRHCTKVNAREGGVGFLGDAASSLCMGTPARLLGVPDLPHTHSTRHQTPPYIFAQAHPPIYDLQLPPLRAKSAKPC